MTEPPPMEVLFPGDRKIDVLYRGFRIETDQPRGDGSPGDAPEPLDLFFASLATCVGLTAAVFCRARDLPTDGMRLSLRRTWDPEEKRYTRVRLDLALPKGFPVKYRSAVVQAMGHCSVKKHLAHPPELLFEARLADEPAVAPE